MRTARIRFDQARCYYHLMNRVAGEPGYLPFGDVEKEYLFRLAQRLSRFYTLDILTLVVMGNHWHVACAAYPELPSVPEMQRRFRDYYGPVRAEPNWEDASVCECMGRRMRDISMFAKDLQQLFTTWFNETRPKRRRGTLWAGRFKNVILDGESALWECIKYLEMNPVRAHLCADPGEYRFSTWGRLCGSGRHPFGRAFVDHLREYLGERAVEFTQPQVIAELAGDIARVVAAERGESSEAIFEAEKTARRKPPVRLRLTSRVRYWSDGAIIGSKLFMLKLTAELFGRQRAESKRFAATQSAAGTMLFAFRQLRDT